MLPNSEFQIPLADQTPEVMTGAITGEYLSQSPADSEFSAMTDQYRQAEQAIFDAEFAEILEANGYIIELGVEIHESRSRHIDHLVTSRKPGIIESMTDLLKRII